MVPTAGSAHHLAMAIDAAERDSWKQAAACRGASGVDFYPETDAGVRRAKAVCSTCTVRDVCLQTALRNGERHGIWGGLTEPERARLRRNLRLVSRPA